MNPDPANDNPALTLGQKLAISITVAVLITLAWHYAGNYYVRKNAAELGRFPVQPRRRAA